ncbi:hypothetical protein [Paraburkholderia sp. SIMBA_054]|uniref:hypothetical protein n=1 Tax=Paraburkholderia sp. SIMBA_054 TaxID=3085795 RepID=UPI003977F211
MAAEPVVLKDTRSGLDVPWSGELLTRLGDTCTQVTYGHSAGGLPLPVVDTRSFACDPTGTKIQSTDASHQAVDHVLMLQTVREGDTEILLPTVATANGDVCVSYIESASRDDGGALIVTMPRVCDKPGPARGPAASWANLTGQRDMPRPAKLKAMRAVSNGGLVTQIPDIDSPQQ